MPTYDYVCDACGHRWEAYQPMTEKPHKTCPECKKKKARREIGTGAGVIFKGSGFYETDYRSESYQAGAKQDAKTSESKSDSKGESKSDTKSDSGSSSTSSTDSSSKSSDD